MYHIDNLDIRRDEIFKAVFTKETPESRAALTGLLSAFLERKVTVISVTANELAVSDMRQRQIRYDIGAKIDDNEPVDIEMMLHPIRSDKVRMEYYLARLFSSQDIKGKEKNYTDLKRTWQLSIAGNGRFFDDTELFHQFYYYDPIRRIALGGRTSIHTLELSKLDKTLTKPVAEMNSLERWSVFIRYYTDETKQELLQEIWAHEEAIKMAMQVAQGFTQDELEFFRKMSIERSETAWDDALDEAREDAFSEGKVKGRAEGRAETQKLLALLKSGKTIAEAEQLLGLNAN